MFKMFRNYLFFPAICFFLLINSALSYNDEAVNYYNQGISLVQAGKLSDGAACFVQAIKEDPTLADAYFNLGSVYKKLNRKDEAINNLKQYLKINPSDNEAPFLLANIYMNKGEYKTALLYLSALPLNSSKSKEILLLKAKALQQIKESEKKSVKFSNRTYDKFNAPAGIAIDSKGYLYVANYFTGVIQKISPNSSELRQEFVSSCIKKPIGLAIDSKDNIYVANAGFKNIVKISADGKVLPVLDKVSKPFCLYIKDDILYVSDQGKDSVILINLAK